MPVAKVAKGQPCFELVIWQAYWGQKNAHVDLFWDPEYEAWFWTGEHAPAKDLNPSMFWGWAI